MLQLCHFYGDELRLRPRRKDGSGMQFPLSYQQIAAAGTRFLDFLYYTGVQTARVLKRIQRRAAAFWAPAAAFLHRGYEHVLGRRLRHAKREFVHFFGSAAASARRLRRERREGVAHTPADYLRTARNGASRHKKLLLTAVNVAVPAVCLCALAGTVLYWGGTNYGLELSYGGEYLGTVADEGVFERAAEMMSGRLAKETTEETDLSMTPSFTLTRTGTGGLTASTALCDLMIERSGEIIEEASGLYVDGELLGAVRSSADLSYILQSLLNDAAGGDKDAEVSFVKDVQTVKGLFPTSSVVSSEEMSELLTGKVEEEVEYTVQAGDTATAIATRYNLSLAELNELNDDQAGDYLTAGMTLKVSAARSLLDVQVTKEETYEEEIPYQTVTIKDDSQYTDYTSVKTAGQNGVQQVVDKVTYVNGVEVGRTNVSTQVVTPAVDREVITGTKERPKLSGVGTGSMIWPVPSIHHITSYYEWRWGTMHNGLDISGGNSYGKTIVAADSGTVSYVKYLNTGYGYHLLINHGNGISTMYAHASEILVQPGEKVEKGQPIALIGSTGNSTGAHCHFEVRVNGSPVNPLNYVSN